MRKYLFLPLSLFVLTVFLAGVSFSQEEEKEANYSWGIVKSVSPAQIVLTEQDEETGSETDVTYNIDLGVELNNAAKIEDIAVGNSIGIEYEVAGDNKVAKVIDVEEASQEEASDNPKPCG